MAKQPTKSRAKQRADLAFSWAVRESHDWTCARCGIQEMPPTKKIQCSHVFGRRHLATRWCSENCVAHCAACHHYLGSNPLVFAAWFGEFAGDARAEIIRVKHLAITHFTVDDYLDCEAHYKAELERLQKLRAQGTRGYIPLENWA